MCHGKCLHFTRLVLPGRAASPHEESRLCAGATLLVARGSSAKPEFERVALPAAGAADVELQLEQRLVRCPPDGVRTVSSATILQ